MCIICICFARYSKHIDESSVMKILIEKRNLIFFFLRNSYDLFINIIVLMTFKNIEMFSSIFLVFYACYVQPYIIAKHFFVFILCLPF